MAYFGNHEKNRSPAGQTKANYSLKLPKLHFKREVAKLQKWADDRIHAIEKAIRDTKTKILDLERQANAETDMQALLETQKKISDLKKKQRRQHTEIFEVEDEIEAQRDQIIKGIEVRM